MDVNIRLFYLDLKTVSERAAFSMKEKSSSENRTLAFCGAFELVSLIQTASQSGEERESTLDIYFGVKMNESLLSHFSPLLPVC